MLKTHELRYIQKRVVPLAYNGFPMISGYQITKVVERGKPKAEMKKRVKIYKQRNALGQTFICGPQANVQNAHIWWSVQ